MRLKGWLVLASVVAAAALVGVAAQPLFAFQALAKAAQIGDRDRLASLVDFPAVRDSLKTQLDSRLEGAIDKDKGLASSPFGALGALLAPQVVDQVVEAAVTPDGIAAILKSGRAPLSDLVPGRAALPPPTDTAPPAPEPGSDATPKPHVRFAYPSLDRFKATSFSRGGAPLGWVMGREGLTWRLVAIELPPA